MNSGITIAGVIVLLSVVFVVFAVSCEEKEPRQSLCEE